MGVETADLLIRLRADLKQYESETTRVFNASIALSRKAAAGFTSVEKALNNLNRAGAVDVAKVGKNFSNMGDQTEKALNRVEKKIKKTATTSEQSFQKIERTSIIGSRALIAFAGVVTSVLSVRKIQEYADMFTTVQNKIKTVLGPTENLADVTGRLLAIANGTRTSLDATATLYTRLRRNSEELGLSQEQLFDITETVNKSFAISGATTQETAGAIRQLSQAFASGVLRGDEFNSIAEQAPVIMEAISKSTGIAKGALRELAADGKISARVVSESLLAYKDVIEADFLPATVTAGQAQEVLSNNFTIFVGEMDKAFGITESTVGLYTNMSTALTAIQQPLMDSALFMEAFFEVMKDGTETGETEIQDLVKTYDNQLSLARDLFGAFGLVVSETLLFIPDVVKRALTSSIAGIVAFIDEARKQILLFRQGVAAIFGDDATVSAIEAQLQAIGDSSTDIFLTTLENQIDGAVGFFDDFGKLSEEMNQAIADKKLEILAATDAKEIEMLKLQLEAKREALLEFEENSAGKVKLDTTEEDDKKAKKKLKSDKKDQDKAAREKEARIKKLSGVAAQFARQDKDIATQAFQFAKDKAASSIILFAAEGAEKVIAQLGLPGIPIAGGILAAGGLLAAEVSGLGIGSSSISSGVTSAAPSLVTSDIPTESAEIETSITTETGRSQNVISFEGTGNLALDAIFELFSEALRTGKITGRG